MSADRKTLKFQMMMSATEAEVLDNWMFANRVRSRAEAIRLLCAAGLAAHDHPRQTSHIEDELYDALEQLLVKYLDAAANDARLIKGQLKPNVENEMTVLAANAALARARGEVK